MIFNGHRYVPDVTYPWQTFGKTLELDEGFENGPYKDTKNYWTIGVGHFIGHDLKRLKLCDDAIRAQLQHDMKSHWQIAVDIFGDEYLQALPVGRQCAIMALCFNLGSKFKTWTNTIALIKDGQWARVADLLLAYKWAKDVDPRQRKGQGRDDRVSYMFRTGELHPEYAG